MINFSFIIPHKNTPELLRKALSSIPRRDDVEIIVVDDNSDPDVVDFQYFPGNDRDDIQLVLTKEGKGAGYARNVGLQRAKGKWMLFCDSDDYYTQELTSFLNEYEDSNADVVFLKSTCWDLDTESMGHRGETVNEFIDEGAETGCFENALLVSCPWKLMYARQFLIDNKITFNECRWGNDVVFSTKVAVAAKKIECSTKAVYCITQHASFGLISNNTLESSLVRFHQEVESIRIARKKFNHNQNLHKWFFDTWFAVYKFNKIQGLKILPIAILSDKWHFVKECIKSL